MSPMPLYASPFKKDRVAGMAVSFFLHSFIFIGGGFVLTQPVQYAVEAGTGGIEVSLTAAPADPVEAAAPAPEPLPVLEEDKIEDPQPASALPQKVPVPSADGKDKLTFYSAGGAFTEAKPNYLKNPAPPYPFEARQNGWQGTTILRVSVDKSGYPSQVELEKSSGYDTLDRSAMKTVRKWRFRAAQMGALTVESTVRVPVRFELNSRKED